MSVAEQIVYQIHLSGFGHSGRGVRVRQLEPEMVHECEAAAAAAIGKEGSALAYRQATLDEGVARMVKEVTEAPVIGARSLRDADVSWRAVTLQEMKHALSSIFTSKDVAMLESLYSRLHEVSQAAVEEIMGKALAMTD